MTYQMELREKIIIIGKIEKTLQQNLSNLKYRLN
jgi:hypothetical protein